MTSGKRVRLPAAPELTDGPDLMLRQPLPDDIDDMVVQCRDPEFQRWTTIPVPYHQSDAEDFLTRVAEGWQGSIARFAIVYEHRYAGTVDLRFDGIGGAGQGRDDSRAAAGVGLGFRAAGHRGDVLACASGQLGVATGRRTVRVPNGRYGPRAARTARCAARRLDRLTAPR
jgi:hypothetical protein